MESTTHDASCKWMLRAAYFGQELLSTFGTSIGEIALIPATGGLFTVHLTYNTTTEGPVETREVLLWDRKAEGGFPETKILKRLVRDHIQPEKDLGHSDRPSSKVAKATESSAPTSSPAPGANDALVATASAAESSSAIMGDNNSEPTKADAKECEDCT
ncbi:hypothetical protein LTS14_005453 [Recurvomyces mirabilis]|uniref:uncharacterized protein n=1 Tax=Recurvomyces mirabilis TaxID=574656 RepID=UPI002DE0BEA0|nr:hypothetical protein LTS14_005453 [Recurvomyces mirabilis]